jgi:hypothetical protein
VAAAARAIVGAALLASCSGATGPTTAAGSQATLPSGIASNPAIASPGASAGNPLGGAITHFSGGTAHVVLGSTPAVTLELKLIPGSGMLVGGGNVILNWSGAPGTDKSDDDLSVQAPGQPGSVKSSSGFVGLALHIVTGQLGTRGAPEQFNAGDNQCTVDFTKVDATGVQGTLTCTGLTSSGYKKPIDAQGTFSATP